MADPDTAALPPPRPAVARTVRIFSVLVALAALACGAAALRQAAERFAQPPRVALPAPLRERLRTVEDRLPAGASVFYVSEVPEYWFSRLWQRALYPGHLAILVQPEMTQRQFDELRVRYGVRYAISAGQHPRDPGFAWKIDLGYDTWAGSTWFGELQP
jgi:hypothetical protein